MQKPEELGDSGSIEGCKPEETGVSGSIEQHQSNHSAVGYEGGCNANRYLK